jgi:bacterial/archaeal transporter family-2 protein
VNGLLAAWVVVMGAGLSLQPLINAQIARTAGHPVYGALISVAVSTVTMGAGVLVGRLDAPDGRALSTAPWWMWSGGVIGAFVVLAALTSAPRLGSATTVALFIAGQLAASLVIDQLGVLGVPVHPLDWKRVLGVVCLVAGVVLIRWA